jgi:hypothetical protein
VGSIDDTADLWWAVSMTPLILAILTGSGSTQQKIWFRIHPQYNILPQWHCWQVLGSVNATKDLSWAVSVPRRFNYTNFVQKLTIGQRCKWHCWPMLGSLRPTGQRCHIWSAVSYLVSGVIFGQQCHTHCPPLVSCFIDTAHHRTVVSLTPPTPGQLVIDTAVH